MNVDLSWMRIPERINGALAAGTWTVQKIRSDSVLIVVR